MVVLFIVYPGATILPSLWPNWIRRLTTNQKIGGSSPSRDILFSFCCGSAATTTRLDPRTDPGRSACSVMVIIGASQALDPGSIPGRRISAFWGISSIGRVRALQARGTGIETPMLHARPIFLYSNLGERVLSLSEPAA